jgi:hypothetical protein
MIRLSSVFLPMLFAACASSGEVRDEKLVRLPAEDRQALRDEERAVDVAEANLEAARAAVSEAQRFRSIVGDETEAAEARNEAADKTVELEKETGDQQGAKAAEQRKRVEAESLNALRSKDEYAKRLLELRQEERKLREAEFELAQTRLEGAEYEALKARGMAEGLEEKDFDQALREAEQEAAEARQKAIQARGYAEAAREAWNEARQQYETTDRRMGADEAPITAPRPPEQLPPPAAKKQAP